MHRERIIGFVTAIAVAGGLAVLSISLISRASQAPAPIVFDAGTLISSAAVNHDFAQLTLAVNSKQDMLRSGCDAGSGLQSLAQDGTPTCVPLGASFGQAVTGTGPRFGFSVINTDGDGGVGLLGVHSALTGVGAGVEGLTNSSAANAAGVSGIVGPGGGPQSAGVLGENASNANEGAGVVGIHEACGAGVYGLANCGTGIVGVTETGTAVAATSTAPGGSGFVAFTAAVTDSALEIDQGAIRVHDAGIDTATAAFIHVATTSDISGGATTITNPLTDGDPDAILLVTPNASAGTTKPTAPVGVQYASGHWQIYTLTGANLTDGMAFNVLVIKT